MYTVGAVVDGFELTRSGEWVRRSPTAGSPYRLGDVVDGHMLDADLTWVPLRRSPSAPFVAGDVVDEHLLTPDGEWVPLADRVRARVDAGARRTAARTGGEGTRGAEQSAAQRAATRAGEQRRARERAAAERREETRSAAASARTTERRDGSGITTNRDPGGGQDATSPARRTYQVGDVVNGHVLLPDHRWVPVPVPGGSARSGAPRPATSQQVPAQRDSTPRRASRTGGTDEPRRGGRGPFVPLLVLGFVVLQAVRACG